MTLRKANDRTLRRRIFGFALRSSLAAVVATSVSSGVSAQQTAIVLPALPTCASDVQCQHSSTESFESLEVRRERLVKLLGLRDKQPAQQMLPALPTLPSAAVALPPFPNFDEPTVTAQAVDAEQAAVTQSVELPAMPTAPAFAEHVGGQAPLNQPVANQPANIGPVAQVVWQPSESDTQVRTASANVSARVDDSDEEEITLTITGEVPNDDSFDSIEIPLSLPLEPSGPVKPPRFTAPQIQPPQIQLPEIEPPALQAAAPETTQGAQLPRLRTAAPQASGVVSESTSARQVKPRIRAPQIVASGPAMQLSSPAKPESGAGTEFSLSDSSVDDVAQNAEAKMSSRKPAESITQTRPEKQGSSMLRPIGGSQLPSTSSSRGAELSDIAVSSSRKAPSLASDPSGKMEVRIDGETSSGSSDAIGLKQGSLAARPAPPAPEAMVPTPTAPPPLKSAPSIAQSEPKRFTLRDGSTDASGDKQVTARLSSSSKSLPTLEITDDATKVSSRQGSRDIVAPPPSYEITSRIKVVAEQSSTIAVRDAILQTSIEDPSICRLIQSGDTGLSVVGLKAGTTRIAVVTAGRFGEPKVNVHEVSVGHGHQARIGLTELAAGIDETINRLYPTSDIRVAAGEGKLVVEGKASSESEAKRVLGLVRRTSLLPVVDRLDVR